MQRELTDLQPQLVVASKEVDEIMVNVERESVEVAKVEKVLFRLHDSTNNQDIMGPFFSTVRLSKLTKQLQMSKQKWLKESKMSVMLILLKPFLSWKLLWLRLTH